MPIYTVKTNKKVSNDISEVSRTYEIPKKIAVENNEYEYFNSIETYVCTIKKDGNRYLKFLTAKEYLDMQLQKQNQKNLNNDGKDM